MRSNIKILVLVSLTLNFRVNLQISDWSCSQLKKSIPTIVNCPSFERISKSPTSSQFSIFCRYFAFTMCHLNYSSAYLTNAENSYRIFCALDIMQIHTNSSLSKLVHQRMQRDYDKKCYNITVYRLNSKRMSTYHFGSYKSYLRFILRPI